MDDPNLNPAWDAFMGEDTNSGVIRLLIGIVIFVAIGGTLFWFAG
jgi:hypothetical protein